MSPILETSQQIYFYGLKSSASRSVPNLEDQGIPFVWVVTFDLSSREGHTCSYAMASIALRIIFYFTMQKYKYLRCTEL